MATAARTPPEDTGGEYKRPDAAAAFKIYDREIAPKKSVIAEKTGDLSDPYSRIKDQCHFPRKILDLIVYLAGLEDAKRDHMLLAMSEGLKVKKLFMPRDLATIAEGTDGDPIIPAEARPKTKLVAVPSDGSETDLAEAAQDGFEMSEAELAAQKDRPAAGTGAAAIAAMKAAAEEPEPAAEPSPVGEPAADPAE